MSTLGKMILWGATGQARVLRECMAHAGHDVVAVFDNDPTVECPFPGVPLFVGRAGFERWRERQADFSGMGFLVAIGGEMGRDRLEIQEWLGGEGLSPLTAVHPRAFVAADARVGEGSQILAQAAVCVEATIGRACIVNTGATIDHECVLGDGVHVAPGAHLAGCVEIGRFRDDRNRSLDPAQGADRRECDHRSRCGGNTERRARSCDGGKPSPKAGGGKEEGMSAGEEFDREKRAWAERMSRDGSVAKITRAWFDETARYRYSYNFTWLGRPIIQYPQDIVALQQVVWETKPDLIVETGVAHGGSLVLSASLLRLLGGEGRVVGIDIDIRTRNREAIERHPMAPWISLIEGSSTSEAVLEQVRAVAASYRKVMVILDSNHTHEHVARELELYSPLVCKGSYLIVMDTVIEDMAPGAFPDRPWGPGNNPKTAVREFLARNSRFVVDEELERTLLISVAPSGYLRCVQD